MSRVPLTVFSEDFLWSIGKCAVQSPETAGRAQKSRQRTRWEMLLWGGGVFGFLAILYYLIRDTGPKPDAP
jgi:hypothetical protein